MPTFYNGSTFWSVFSQLFSSFCINYQEKFIFFCYKFLYTALFKKYRYIHLSTCCNADEPFSFMIILYCANKNNEMAFHQISQKQQSDRQWLSESETCHISKWHALSSSSIHSANDVWLPRARTIQRNKRDNSNTNKYRDLSRVYRCSTCR